MANRVAFVNGKGGVGKTTGVFNVAGILSKEGEKVLVIDFDKQRNATDTLLMNSEFPDKTVFDVMWGAAPSTAVCNALFQSRGNAKPKYYGVSCMAGDIRLESDANVRDVDAAAFGRSISEYIETEGYTWLLVDMPPSSMHLNDICFAHLVDYLVVPLSADVYSVSGYSDILITEERARSLNPNLSVLGIYLSRFTRCAAHDYVRSRLTEFGDIFIDVQIPNAVDICECAIKGSPISYYRSSVSSRSRKAYEDLVAELKRRITGGWQNG